MNNSFSFHKTVVPSTSSLPTLDKLEGIWDKAIESYEAGKFKDALLATLDYANIELRKKFGNNTSTEFHIPHGSVTISVKIDNEKISVDCPFVKLPTEARIPLMRRIAEINFHPLGLSQIILENDELHFHYSCPLELCYPHKMYDVFREICTNADYYDDEFVTEFKAVRIQEPKVTHYDSTVFSACFQKFQEYLSECTEYVSYFEGKRMTGYAWDSLNVCFKKIDYFVQPQGKIGNMLHDAIEALDNHRVHMLDRVSAGKKVLAQLQKITEKELSEDLYFSEIFVPWKRYGKLENIQEYFENPYETATSEMNDGKYMACVCTIQLNYLNMLYYYRLTPEIQKFVEHNLEESSSKPWKEAAELLYNSLDNFMEGDLLTAMKSGNFDTTNFMNALGGGNIDMNEYMKQAMEMSKSIMAQFLKK